MATTTVPVDANTIRMYKGDAVTIRCSVVTASDGSVTDLTSFPAIGLCVKREKYDDDVDALFIITGTFLNNDPTTGVVLFPVAIANSNQRPGRYHYDVHAVDTTGQIVKTLAEGPFIIEWNVTRTAV